MDSEENREYISERWHALTTVYTQDHDLIEQFLQEIIKAYSQPKRHYHNLAHIEQMLRLSDEHAHSLLDKAVVDFAIFYHDFIYKVPALGSNEKKSAAWAAKRLKSLAVPDQMTQQVVIFIEATATHELVEVVNRDDLRYFLDFDMAILAAGWDEYARYFRNVRREYKYYADIMYYPGRADFLMKTLAQKKIYHTEIFRAEKEENARRNISKELKHEIKRWPFKKSE